MFSCPLKQDNKEGPSAKMRRMTEEALEKGETTDFSFLVGAEEEAQLVPCCKFNLMLASDYFRALLRSPLTGPPPVRIKHVQPHIFKLILRFITVFNIPKMSSIDDAVDLTLAADEFLLDVLQPFCKSELKRLISVSNVWQTLEKCYDNPLIHSLCAKVLSAQPLQCLNHWKIEENVDQLQKSTLLFLKMDDMDIFSEIDLVKAFLHHSVHSQDRKKLMKAVMPHLRLMTLMPNEVTWEVLNHLSEPEKDYILERLHPFICVNDQEVPSTLNPNTSHRVLSSVANEISPGKYCLKFLPNTKCRSPYSRKKALDCDSSTLAMYSCSDVRLKGIGFVSGFTNNEFKVEVSCQGELRLSYEISKSGRTKSDQMISFFKQPLWIPKGVRLEIKVTSEIPIECRYISSSTSTSCKQEGVFSKFYFKSSVHDRFNRSIVKCFLIKFVNFEIV